ncbi:MAG TPA: secretin N-terminal domain-containing protein, partial [Candidatus Limnocylindria bacterium]|nr:secretin N-terminal domain-containing protein [Candidatus Limnocylindria bacterium]
MPPAEEPLGEDEAMVLNFEKADVREVIHSLATALGLSYTIDPAISGDITIRTTGRIPRRELPALFNEILRANGIAAIKQGALYHIVPVDQAKARAILPRTPRARQESLRDDTFVIEIIGMRHVAAEEMANILTPFLTPGGELFSYPRANTVVVVDLRSNVERLRELAATFDVDGYSNLKARVYKLKEGDPEELTNEILSLLGPYSGGAGDGSGGLFMIPLYRLNSIVAFSYDPAAFVEIERWLTLLDIPPEKGSGRQTFVYNVENAKAADLAAVLNELFGEGGGTRVDGTGRSAGQAPAGVGLFGAGGTSGTRGSPRSTRGGVGGVGSSRPRGSFGGGGGGGGGANFASQQGGFGERGGVGGGVGGGLSQRGGAGGG